MEPLITDILAEIDAAVVAFQETVPGVQSAIFEELQPIIKQLQLKNGRILNNVSNLKLIGQLQNKLERLIITTEYKAAVSSFLDTFKKVADLNHAYFKQFNAKFTPAETLPILRELSIESTITDLLGQGMFAGVVAPIQDILRQNTTVGGSYADFQEQLRKFILSEDNQEGVLERHTKQITTDALNQYQAQYHEAIAQDLNFSWGQYIGSLLTTSRELCEHLVEKRWIHKTELPAIISGDIDGEQVKLSKTTGLPLGMIPGTTPDNFKVLRGGYNCGHQFFYGPDSIVPEKVKAAFAKGPGAIFKTKLDTNVAKIQKINSEREKAIEKLNAARKKELDKVKGDPLKTQEIIKAYADKLEKIPAIIDTQALYTNPRTGEYIPTRMFLHGEILSDYLKNGSTNSGTSYFTGGAPAVGKGGLVDRIQTENPGILVVDPDRVKTEYIPEYEGLSKKGDSRAAAIVHEESSMLSKKIVSIAADQKFDIIYDGVGDGGYDGMAKKVQQQRKAGKKVVADYATVDVAVSLQRAIERGKKTGRFVPETYIKNMHKAISNLVPEFIKNNLFDELNLWNTTSKPPVLILTHKNGKTKIFNKSLYERFLAQGK